MAKQRIDSLFDVAKIQKEVDKINGFLQKTISTIEKQSGNKKPIMDPKSLKDVSAALGDVVKKTKDLDIADKAINRERNKSIKLQAQISTQNKQNIKDQERLKVVKKELMQQAREEATVNQYGAKSIKGLQIRLREAQDEYYRLSKAQGENSAVAKQQQQVVMQLQGEYYKAQQSTKYFAVNMNEVSNGTRIASMSIKQMQDELLRLKSVDFTAQGLNPKQIQQVQVRMAQLTDGIGDANARIKMMATDTIPLFGMGLQTLVGGAQAVTGTLRAFGVENVALERSMMALINVSMGLQTIQKAYNDRLGSAIKLRIKEIFSTKQMTVVRKGEILATRGATKATRLWGNTMKAVPIVAIIAGVAALAAGIVMLVKYLNKGTVAQKMMSEANLEGAKNAAAEQTQLMILSAEIVKNVKSRKNTSDLVAKFNEQFKEYGANLSEEGNLLANLETQYKNVSNAMLIKYKIAAYEEKITELMLEQVEAQMRIQELQDGDDTWVNVVDWFSKASGNIIDLTTIKMANNTEVIKDNGDAVTALINEIMNLKNEYNALAPASTSASTSFTKSVENMASSYEKLQAIDGKSLGKIEIGAETELQQLEILTAVYKGNMDSLKKMEESGVITWEQYIDYSNRYYDRLRLIADEEAAQEQAQARIDQAFQFASVTEDVFGKVTEVIGNNVEKQTQILENGYNTDLANLQERYDQGLISEDSFNLQKQALEEEYKAEKLRIEKQQFEREKAIALAGIAIDTAKAVSNAISESTVTFGLPFSAYALAQGIAQAAVISSQQFPAYRTGRRGGNAEYAYVHPGEIVEHGDKMFLTPNKPETLTYLPKDSSVYTANETSKILQFYGQSSTQSNGWEQVVHAIHGQEGVNINITRSGIHGLARSGDSLRHYRNANFKYSNSRKTW